MCWLCFYQPILHSPPHPHREHCWLNLPTSGAAWRFLQLLYSPPVSRLHWDSYCITGAQICTSLSCWTSWARVILFLQAVETAQKDIPAFTWWQLDLNEAVSQAIIYVTHEQHIIMSQIQYQTLRTTICKQVPLKSHPPDLLNLTKLASFSPTF